MFVAVDERPAGALILLDPVRPDAAATVRNLRRSGIREVVMITGDRPEVAASVAALLGIDDVLAQQSPTDKVDAVRAERARGRTIMVGDGINDAPALAAADVGVAIGARGATASSETADVVLTVDRLDRLGEARLIAARSRRIATQSVVVGMVLSVVAMLAAAARPAAARRRRPAPRADRRRRHHQRAACRAAWPQQHSASTRPAPRSRGASPPST